MDPKIVSKPEDKLLHSIAGVIMELGLKRLALLPSHQTMHLMAKAAVAVYACRE